MTPIVEDGVHVLPVLHERLEYADLVRLTAAELQPDAIAVEIPSSLEREWLRAIDRLPQISALLYENAAGRTIYIPVQPGDPIVEAARFARERGLPIRCADLDVDGYADYRDPVPDPYALLRLGLPRILETFRSFERPEDPQDRTRESAMAYHALRLRADGAQRVLLVCGMLHADGVGAALGADQAQPLTPPVRKNIRLVNLHPESLGCVLTEIPFYVAAYEARRCGLPDEPNAGQPEPAGRTHGPFRVLSGGHGDEERRLEDCVARAANRAGARECAWSLRTDRESRPVPLDRLRLQWSLCREAEQALVAAAPDEEIRNWQRQNLARFTRNLALSSGQLVADLFDLLAAARGCISANYAWELHRLATGYPAQSAAATDLPTVRIRADELFDGVRRLRLDRRFRKPKRPDWRRLLRKRRDERWAGEWLEGFDGDAICSYPPEDIVIEDFGRYLKRRGKSVLTAERARTVPFTTSVLDGIDVRETIRNWHDGRLMVRELGRAPGDVGSVVVVCEDEELSGSRYPYMQTWHGEHEQESDMAFYSTDPGQAVVGPGICRTTYGGFVLSYPPMRMADVWTDPDYRSARTKAETLLLAALDYCEEQMVAYIGPTPPRSIFTQIATAAGLKIVYVPLGTISPSTLRRVRVMHILSGHDKRETAKEFIW